jgi:hypothetical protein
MKRRGFLKATSEVRLYEVGVPRFRVTESGEVERVEMRPPLTYAKLDRIRKTLEEEAPR